MEFLLGARRWGRGSTICKMRSTAVSKNTQKVRDNVMVNSVYSVRLRYKLVYTVYGDGMVPRVLKHGCVWPTSTGKQATCKPLEDATVLQIATQLGKTPAQVLIRWGIQRGTVVIPKSINPERIANNFDVSSWELPEDAMAQLSSFRCTT